MATYLRCQYVAIILLATTLCLCVTVTYWHYPHHKLHQFITHKKKPKEPIPFTHVTHIKTFTKPHVTHTERFSEPVSVNLSGTQSTAIDLLTWTSLESGNDKDTNFFSAYFDGRKDVPERNVVVVFGYHMKSLKISNWYCLFTYMDKTSSVCLTEAAKQVGFCTGGLDADKVAEAFSYVCKVKCRSTECTNDEIPTFVALSRNSDCAEASDPIPVRNRQLPRTSEKKTFGVCVQSPVYGQSVGLQQISEFIEMNQVLGAEIITLYFMEMKEDMLQFLQDHYAKEGLLRLVKWKKLEKWNPLHYFGQTLIMHDCLHRNMHRVKYLALVDLDELIVPLKHQNWQEMITFFGGDDDYHSYQFGNCFYIENKDETSKIAQPCKEVSVPKYFQRTSRRTCYCNDRSGYRQKYIMRTEYIIDMFIHWVCKAVNGKKQYKVSHRVAVNAHYRDTLPQDCSDKSSIHDTTLLKYQSQVMSAMGQRMCS